MPPQKPNSPWDLSVQPNEEWHRLSSQVPPRPERPIDPLHSEPVNSEWNLGAPNQEFIAQAAEGTPLAPEPYYYPLRESDKIGYFRRIVDSLLVVHAPDIANYYPPTAKKPLIGPPTPVEDSRKRFLGGMEELFGERFSRFGLTQLSREDARTIAILVSNAVDAHSKATGVNPDELNRTGSFPITLQALDDYLDQSAADAASAAAAAEAIPQSSLITAHIRSFGTGYELHQRPTADHVEAARTILHAFVREAYHPTYRITLDGMFETFERTPIDHIEEEAPIRAPSSRVVRPLFQKLIKQQVFDPGIPDAERRLDGEQSINYFLDLVSNLTLSLKRPDRLYYKCDLNTRLKDIVDEAPFGPMKQLPELVEALSADQRPVVGALLGAATCRVLEREQVGVRKGEIALSRQALETMVDQIQAELDYMLHQPNIQEVTLRTHWRGTSGTYDFTAVPTAEEVNAAKQCFSALIHEAQCPSVLLDRTGRVQVAGDGEVQRYPGQGLVRTAKWTSGLLRDQIDEARKKWSENQRGK